MAEYILSAQDIKKSFGGIYALDGVELNIKRGETHCLAGENGCGKSTLIKIISGVYQADSGSFTIDGKRFSHITPAQAIDAGVQVIYQDFSLFPNLTVMENLAFNREIANRRSLLSYRRMKQTALEALGKIGLSLDLKTRVADLPIADRQLIAIARALLSDAKLIIMDEPTSALTKKEVANLFRIIAELKEQGVSILFVSHKLDEVFQISDSITIFRSGRHVVTCPAAEMDRRKFSYYMTGREFSEETERPSGDESDVVLETRGLGLRGAFEDVNLSLRRGEILGITGQLGSGRTELALSLFGLERPDGGAVLVEGKPVRIRRVADAEALGIAYVPEDRLTEGLFLPRSITINSAVTRLDALSGPAGTLRRAEMERETADWISRLSIAASDQRSAVGTLSGGNQQKVVLSKWLSRKPKILILNGPTFGVDIGAKYDIYHLLRTYARAGMSIIVASDDLAEVAGLCSRVLVMKDGRICGVFEGEQVTESNLALATA
ncbi:MULTISPECIES: sugar ABC transporter ATP-binding protein [Anaerotruncus]|uniref:sugar ABC transporter ATP-binding protein n=1 Tax=Anaerotruncus TaxID=244127 RepID=UPI0018F3C3BD|nr:MULTISPECIES: sugar ABC transporter ATP-binding protein [Anaerotruncus]